MDRLIAAEEAIADQAAAADTFADLYALWIPDDAR